MGHDPEHSAGEEAEQFIIPGIKPPKKPKNTRFVVARYEQSAGSSVELTSASKTPQKKDSREGREPPRCGSCGQPMKPSRFHRGYFCPHCRG